MGMYIRTKRLRYPSRLFQGKEWWDPHGKKQTKKRRVYFSPIFSATFCLASLMNDCYMHAQSCLWGSACCSNISGVSVGSSYFCAWLVTRLWELVPLESPHIIYLLRANRPRVLGRNLPDTRLDAGILVALHRSGGLSWSWSSFLLCWI